MISILKQKIVIPVLSQELCRPNVTLVQHCVCVLWCSDLPQCPHIWAQHGLAKNSSFKARECSEVKGAAEYVQGFCLNSLWRNPSRLVWVVLPPPALLSGRSHLSVWETPHVMRHPSNSESMTDLFLCSHFLTSILLNSTVQFVIRIWNEMFRCDTYNINGRFVD